jgi:hypothetical protein
VSVGPAGARSCGLSCGSFIRVLGFWRNASERTVTPNDTGNSRKCMPQTLADPRIQHEYKVEIGARQPGWRRAPFAATSLPRGKCIDTAIALTLFPYSLRYHVAAPRPTFLRSYYEDSTLSRRTVGMPEADELKDLARLLTSLWEAAQRLPEGSERQDAFRQIGSFHRRVAVIVTGAL